MKRVEYVATGTLERIHESTTSYTEELLKEGNAKTGKRGKYGTMKLTKGLPIHDCPDRTKACEAACYAVKFTLWHAKSQLAGKYSELAHKDPVELHRRLRKDVLDHKGTSPLVVRIHEAGDFVDGPHVDVYYDLATEFPQVQFFGYSRGWVNPNIAPNLIKINGLPNVVIRESLDKDRPVGTGLAPTAYFGPKATEPLRNFKCPQQINPELTCINCGLCWVQKKYPVVFVQH